VAGQSPQRPSPARMAGAGKYRLSLVCNSAGSEELGPARVGLYFSACLRDRTPPAADVSSVA
jgi:hypothetical protein